MPSRSFTPSPRDLPGARQLTQLGIALAALVIAAVLAWQAVQRMDRLASERAALDAHERDFEALRGTMQTLVLNGRAFAITGDSADLAAAGAAARRAETLVDGVVASAAGQLPAADAARLRATVDSIVERTAMLQRAGADAAALARSLVRTREGPVLVTSLFAQLDSLAARAERRRADLVAGSNAAQLRLAVWLPIVALLALGIGVLAALLLRAQLRARAQDLTRYRAIFDNTFQFTGFLTTDGRLLEANRTALAFAGLQAEDVIGKPFWEAHWWSLSADTQRQLKDAIARAAQGEFVRYPVEVAGDAGRRITIDFSLKPVRDLDGRIAYLVPEGRDVTEQLAAESQVRTLQRELSALLEYSPALMTVISRDGRYLHVSQSVAQVAGRPAADMVGRRYEDVLPAQTAAAIRSRLAQVEAVGRPIDVEDTVGTAPDERRYRTVLFPMQDAGGRTFAIGTVAINITAAYQAQRRLQQALDENRVLQGLLSICAQCKQIRDKEDQQWKPVEAYVQANSAAVFSHGLCPTCTAAFIRESGLGDEA